MEEWSGKEKVMKQKGKLTGNRATEKEREIQKKIRAIASEEKKRRERCKSGVHENNHREMRWNEEKGRLEVFQ
jgi:hypothetical protein